MSAEPGGHTACYGTKLQRNTALVNNYTLVSILCQPVCLSVVCRIAKNVPVDFHEILCGADLGTRNDRLYFAGNLQPAVGKMSSQNAVCSIVSRLFRCVVPLLQSVALTDSMCFLTASGSSKVNKCPMPEIAHGSFYQIRSNLFDD